MPNTEELLLQLRNLNYLLNRSLSLAQEHLANSNISTELNDISISLDKLNSSFNVYQSAITNQPWFLFLIGVLVTLVVERLNEFLKERRQRKDYLFNLERLIVDQINMVLGLEGTIERFVDEKLNKILANIDTHPVESYSVDWAFFPLFSTRSLPESVNDMSSGSNYLDNKIGQAYALSKDLPFIVEDTRLQFKETLERNEKISFAKLNSAPAQRKQFKENLLEYKRVLISDMLEKNIPFYLRKFAEALIPVREKIKRYPITWKLIHDPRFKFYLNKANYIKARSEIVTTMDKYFEAGVEKQLKDIDDLRKKAEEEARQNSDRT